jgi:hypothetical protein
MQDRPALVARRLLIEEARDRMQPSIRCLAAHCLLSVVLVPMVDVSALVVSPKRIRAGIVAFGVRLPDVTVRATLSSRVRGATLFAGARWFAYTFGSRSLRMSCQVVL